MPGEWPPPGYKALGLQLHPIWTPKGFLARGDEFTVICKTCGRRALAPLRAFVAAGLGDEVMAVPLRRLRCTTCPSGAPPNFAYEAPKPRQ